MGLMSGTSHDGVDAAIVSIKGKGKTSKVNLLYHYHHPFKRSLQTKISEAFSGRTEDICSLNFELGEVFAEATLLCIKKAGLKLEDIDVIASHGQTIYHMPPQENKAGSTIQIGESSVIAERTGIPVISDFRTRDMAAGGQGAPLVALSDYILFHEKGKVKAVQNIGGIANLTVVPEKIHDVIAFDTGPGMSLIDEAVRLLKDCRYPYDIDGRMAEKGSVIPSLLNELLRHPYLKNPPPKTTGREVFGKRMAEAIIYNFRNLDVRPQDIIATLTHFTALSIKMAYQEFVLPGFRISEIILCGGGCKNRFLVRLLRNFLAPIKLIPIEKYGKIPYQAKEALSFAILANETLSGREGNIPQATGARHPVIVGKLTP